MHTRTPVRLKHGVLGAKDHSEQGTRQSERESLAGHGVASIRCLGLRDTQRCWSGGEDGRSCQKNIQSCDHSSRADKMISGDCTDPGKKEVKQPFCVSKLWPQVQRVTLRQLHVLTAEGRHSQPVAPGLSLNLEISTHQEMIGCEPTHVP